MSWSEVKYAVNSTLGTDRFTSLDQVLINSFGGHQMFTESGTFVVPAGITEIYISACAAGGEGGKGGSSSGGIGGKAGEFIMRERVATTPSEVFTLTVGDGNTTITGENGFSKTLVANSISSCVTNNLLGYKAGYNGGKTVIYNSNDDSFNSSYTEYQGAGGFGGAFGYGGGGGNGYHSSSYYPIIGLGGSEYPLFNRAISPNRSASLINGGEGKEWISSSLPSIAGNAGGYGGGGGGGAGTANVKSSTPGKGSPGMVFIEWGGLRR